MTKPICGICRERNPSFETRCGHHFHRKCLLLWLKKQKTCPYCRTGISGLKKFEYALRHYKGDEEALKNMSKLDLVRLLCHYLNNEIHVNFLGIINSLIKLGWDVQDPLPYSKQMPLYIACANNIDNLARHLIEKGAIVDAFDPETYEYPICAVIENDNIELFELFLENGADLSVVESVGMSPLNYAFHNRSLSIAYKLLQLDVDVNERSCEDNYTPLHYISTTYEDDLPLVYFDDFMRVVYAEGILEKGADINARDNKQLMPIHHAASGGYLKLVESFIQYGRADVNAVAEKGMTPLLYAATKGHSEVAKLLIEHGADVGVFDEENRGVLHFACIQGNLELVKLLIEKGCDINAQDTPPNMHTKTPF